MARRGASRSPAQLSAWQSFESLHPDVQLAILQLLGGAGRRALRGTCAAARALVNGLGAKRATLSAPRELKQLRGLRLHERFPRLERLTLIDADAVLTDTLFAEWAAASLKHMTSLKRLDLDFCAALGAPAALALHTFGTQLEALVLPSRSGGGCREGMMHAPALLLSVHLRSHLPTGAVPLAQAASPTRPCSCCSRCRASRSWTCPGAARRQACSTSRRSRTCAA